MLKRFFYVLLGISVVSAETHLSGDISGKVFDVSGNPYYVESDITIPDGKKVTFKEGCILLFKPFTGMIVSGTIIAEGSQSKPIVFTSINDGEYNSKSQQLPNPFDWNGILIQPTASNTSFKNFLLRYSVYGLKCQTTKVAIKDGLFRQNGQFHVTINDKIQFVQDNILYTYIPINQTEKLENSTMQQSMGNEKKSPKNNLLRYSALTIGISSAITTGILIPLTLDARNDEKEIYSKINNINVTEYRKIQTEATSKRKNLTIGTAIAGTFSVFGFGGFILTFYY